MSFALYAAGFVIVIGGLIMDWTNQCPIPSDLPFEILMIDMNSGALLSKFVYLWTFDAQNNWAILKTVD